MDSSDGRRLTRSFLEGREIIILSERIIPRGRQPDNLKVRYFLFAVLHEVAHAISDHQAPNKISDGENARQEEEADDLAFEWLNAYLKRVGRAVFTKEELHQAQDASQDASAHTLGQQ